MAFGFDEAFSIGSSLFDAALGHYESVRDQHFQSDEAKAQRAWQQQENQRNRDWQEQMYLQYNTPSAMKQQYKDAGYNPYLMMSQNQMGNGISASPPSGSGVAAHGGSLPPGSHLGSNFVQSLGVNAQAANQRANAVKTKWETAASIYRNIGPGAYYQFIKSNPDLFLGDPETALASRQIKADIARTEQDTANSEFALVLQKRYKPQQIEQSLSQGEYAISEAVARLNTMRIQNDIAIKKLANDTLVSLAQAFNLEKQGEYYVASAETINSLRQYVVSTAKSQSLLLGNDLYYSNVYKENFEGAAGYLTSSEGKEKRRSQAEFDLEERSDKVHRFTQMVLDDMGQVIHVGYGDVRSNSNVHSYGTNYSKSESTSTNFNYNY